VCEGEPDAVVCREHCQGRLDTCIRGCEGEVAAVAEPQMPEPNLDDIDPRPTETVADSEPESRPTGKKRPKKKTRKKKKRRR
jgi:hypothetical protein